MTTPTPDWRKLAAIPWSAQVAQVCAALGHTEIPPEGRSMVFQSDLRDMCAWAWQGGGFSVRTGYSTRFYFSAAAVAETTRCRGSGPTNDALRTWLGWWGWEPPAKTQPVTSPTENTRTII